VVTNSQRPYDAPPFTVGSANFSCRKKTPSPSIWCAKPCAELRAGEATVEVLSKVGIDPALLQTPSARVPATAYARLWRLLARRMDDEFFGMDPRKLGPAAWRFCAASMAQPTVAMGLDTGLAFLSLMLDQCRRNWCVSRAWRKSCCWKPRQSHAGRLPISPIG
jgi:hypothetical protein